MKKKKYTPIDIEVNKDVDDVLTGSFETPDDTFPTAESGRSS